MLYAIWLWLDGKKTYIVGAAMVLHGLVITGWSETRWDAAQLEIGTGLGFLGLRNALPKKQP